MKVSDRLYCAFCKLERRIYLKKSITWTNVVLALLASFLVMFILWQQLDPRVIFAFVMFVVIAEVFVRIRWRVSLPCPHCGFDPLLYKKDSDETVKRVRARLEAVRKSEKFLLQVNNPLQHLPKVVTRQESRPQIHKESNLNRIGASPDA